MPARAVGGLQALVRASSFAGHLAYTVGCAVIRLRRQAALGLADPVVVNHMLLWALVGVGGVVAARGPVLVALFGLSAMDHTPGPAALRL